MALGDRPLLDGCGDRGTLHGSVLWLQHRQALPEKPHVSELNGATFSELNAPEHVRTGGHHAPSHPGPPF